MSDPLDPLGVMHGQHWQSDPQDYSGSAAGVPAGVRAFPAFSPQNNPYQSALQNALAAQQGSYQQGLAGQQGFLGQNTLPDIAVLQKQWAMIQQLQQLQPAQITVVQRPKLENGGIKLGEIIAWRWWEYDPQGYLRSCTTSTLWPTSEPLKASAAPNGTGPGIYAFRTEQDAINDRAGPILGRVMLWGTVVEYERGFTGEYARIIALDRWIGQNIWAKAVGAVHNELVALRRAYGLPEDGTPLYSEKRAA